MTDEERKIREQVIKGCLSLNRSGINQGSSGNISVRFQDKCLITPSGLAYENMQPEDLALLTLNSSDEPEFEGPYQPSSEWKIHRDLLKSRKEVQAVIHAHPPYATALAIRQRDIPPVHYMVAIFGGSYVRCAPYALFGSDNLSLQALTALKDRTGCLLAHHGALTLGETLDKALWRMAELEALAKQYILAGGLNEEVPCLSEAEMEAVLKKISHYGIKPRSN